MEILPTYREFGDITLRINGVDIKASKCSLISSSPWFYNLIKANTESFIEINDVDPSVFIRILDFIHIGSVFYNIYF